ncbi:hypothetical protein [Burkholderia semiarida]|uniref:hypothetical protein n=1 Tax=Burkholderia TaxID=32008 RepID=UPI0034587BC2
MPSAAYGEIVATESLRAIAPVTLGNIDAFAEARLRARRQSRIGVHQNRWARRLSCLSTRTTMPMKTLVVVCDRMRVDAGR